jgi:hypothetical protein
VLTAGRWMLEEPRAGALAEFLVRYRGLMHG